MARYMNATPVVQYHGTLTRWHGMWRVVGNRGGRLELRDPWGNRITCRATSATIVDMPRLTELRAGILVRLWDCSIGRIADSRTRGWLRTQKLIEPVEGRPGWYQLTYLGLLAMDSIVRQYR
ncbi:hypothetical protein [Verrucosispora sp. TAA-831]|uniref:hypothetical protein n=1 Tax=Verrucosispora sp. TAA-831 TaxID=3422227 RepID=UPI003D6FE181